MEKLLSGRQTKMLTFWKSNRMKNVDHISEECLKTFHISQVFPRNIFISRMENTWIYMNLY